MKDSHKYNVLMQVKLTDNGSIIPQCIFLALRNRGMGKIFSGSFKDRVLFCSLVHPHKKKKPNQNQKICVTNIAFLTCYTNISFYAFNRLALCQVHRTQKLIKNMDYLYTHMYLYIYSTILPCSVPQIC